MRISNCSIPNIYLPSTNKATYVYTREYEVHKDHLTGLFMKIYLENSFPNIPHRGPISIMMGTNSLNDIDNSVKLIYDALQASGIIVNDNGILHHEHFTSHDLVKKGTNQLYLEVHTIEKGSELSKKLAKMQLLYKKISETKPLKLNEL